ncbi:hypothetical protein GC163_17540 [bacterium]|nr:hypothetical protein [bacterium]
MAAPILRAISSGDSFLPELSVIDTGADGAAGAGSAATGAAGASTAAGASADGAASFLAAPILRIISSGEGFPPAAAGFAAPWARAASRGFALPAGFGAAGALASAFAAGACLGLGPSTTVRNAGSMSYQPISTGPSNSTSARQFMLTDLTLPVQSANRRNSGTELSTTTH